MSPLPISVINPEASTSRAEDGVFSWTVRLSRRQPGRAAQVGAIALGVLALGVCLFHSLWLAVLPVLALLLSLSEFVFPAHYALTKQSASARHGLTSLEIRWSDVRHAYLTSDGIKLSPLRAKNSRFESLRGVFLRFDEDNRDAVIAAVRRLRSEG